jgi:hypothetical protein
VFDGVEAESPLKPHFRQFEALIRKVEMRRFTQSRLRHFPASLCFALATTALAFAHAAGAERPGSRGEDKPALDWVEDLKSPTQGTRTTRRRTSTERGREWAERYRNHDDLDMRATVAAELYRGGYRLVEKDRRLEIERRQSS